jgi:hypothetical protein
MASATRSEQPIISNGFVTCYSDHLIIHLYYFPFGNKKIKYKDIQTCDLLPMKDLSVFKRKMWGMALAPIWWHSDMRRHTREYYILLDANQWPKIGITMEDEDINNVYQLIKKNMNGAMSEEEFEHQKSLESNKAKYAN